MQQHTAGPAGSDAPPTTFRPLDFCGNDDLQLAAGRSHSDAVPVNVALSSRGAGCYFQWTMTVQGARDMAAMLTLAAAEAEAMEAGHEHP